MIAPAAATRVLHDGDAIDLGDRRFEVLHLPGHSPGSIGLWDAATGVLFSGDAVYDGPLLDELDGSDIEAYVTTMHRLRDLPVRSCTAATSPASAVSDSSSCATRTSLTARPDGAWDAAPRRRSGAGDAGQASVMPWAAAKVDQAARGSRRGPSGPAAARR